MPVSKKRKKGPAPSEEAWRTKKVSNRKALAWVLAIPAIGFGVMALRQLEESGNVERVTAPVVSTTQYDHTTAEGTHQHTSAMVEIDGDTFEVKPADGAAPGSQLSVRISRGKLTGNVRMLGLDAGPAPAGSYPIAAER